MNPKLKRLIIFVVVISSVLLVGGIVYTSLLGVANNQYTKTTATISAVETEQKGEQSFVIKSVSVTYTTPDGTRTNKLTGVLPHSIKEGAELEVRYKKDNPDTVTAEMIDWFPAVFLLILGVLYSVGGAMVITFRKKAGYYAIVEQTNDPTPLEDDGFSIADQIEKMEQRENTTTPTQDTSSTDNQ